MSVPPPPKVAGSNSPVVHALYPPEQSASIVSDLYAPTNAVRSELVYVPPAAPAPAPNTTITDPEVVGVIAGGLTSLLFCPVAVTAATSSVVVAFTPRKA